MAPICFLSFDQGNLDGVCIDLNTHAILWSKLKKQMIHEIEIEK